MEQSVTELIGWNRMGNWRWCPTSPKCVPPHRVILVKNKNINLIMADRYYVKSFDSFKTLINI